MTSRRLHKPRCATIGLGAILALAIAPAFVPGHAQAADPPAADADAALVRQTCTACHGASMFAGRHQTRAAWARTVHQMIGYGADVPDDRFDAIVDYLASHDGGPAQPKT